MDKKQVRGVILGYTDFQDQHRYIDVYTKERGYLSILCKYVRQKQLKHAVEPLVVADFWIIEKSGKYQLDELKPIHCFEHLRSQVFISTILWGIKDLLKSLASENSLDSSHEAICDLLLHFFYAAEDETRDIKSLLCLFVLRFLSETGYALQFDESLLPLMESKSQMDLSASLKAYVFDVSEGRFTRRGADFCELTHGEEAVSRQIFLSSKELRLFYWILTSDAKKLYAIKISGPYADTLIAFTTLLYEHILERKALFIEQVIEHERLLHDAKAFWKS